MTFIGKKFHLLKSITKILLNIFIRILMYGIIFLLHFFVGFHFGTQSCEARTIHYGSEIEKVTLIYGGPTIFRFDEEVQTISQASRFQIEPADTQNPNYAVLAITPRFTKGKAKISFILANGVVVNTKMVILPKATPEQTNSFYDFLPKKHLIESPRNVKGSQISDLELMKAMIRQDEVLGYKSRPLSRNVRTGIRGVSAKLVRLYTGPKYNGYVFKVKNQSKKKYTIDLTNLTFGKPNMALLSQVDHKTINPKQKNRNSTLFRVVAKPTSVYYNLSLPMSPSQN